MAGIVSPSLLNEPNLIAERRRYFAYRILGFGFMLAALLLSVLFVTHLTSLVIAIGLFVADVVALAGFWVTFALRRRSFKRLTGIRDEFNRVHAGDRHIAED